MSRKKTDIMSKFKTYLAQSGATLLETTNPYEVVRFKTQNGVSVVYKKNNGSLTFTGEAEDAYDAMLNKNVWRIIPNGLKIKIKILKDIIERDGTNCFYCENETSDETRTIEHLLSVAHGGNNNINNLALACKDCNEAVGSMALVDKIAYRDTLRRKK